MLIAQTHRNLGEVETADQAAAEALAEARTPPTTGPSAGPCRCSILKAMMQGRMADALPMFDRALTVIQADPALTDLWLMLHINKAITLADLDLYEGPLPRPARRSNSPTGPGSWSGRTQAQLLPRRVAVPYRPLG